MDAVITFIKGVPVRVGEESGHLPQNILRIARLPRMTKSREKTQLREKFYKKLGFICGGV
jgi:hypothetical protein